MQPVIGITTVQGKNPNGLPTVMLLQAYVHAIMQAGGVPVLIPSMLAESGWQRLYERLDGILFSGGGDISLDYFDGEPHPRIDGIDSLRDSIELSLLQTAVRDGKPFLGICRGIQTVNVGLGGTLYTHLAEQLPSKIDHAYPGNMRTVLVHEVKIEEGTRLAEILGADPESQQPAPPGAERYRSRFTRDRLRSRWIGRSGRIARTSLWAGSAMAS